MTIAQWYEDEHPGGKTRFLRDFRTALEILKTFPNAGRQRECSSKLRYYPVHPYIISYHVDELSEVIILVGVVHGSMHADVDEMED